VIPVLTIVLPLEGEPFVRLEVASEGEQRRLIDWIDAQVDLVALVEQVLAVIEARTA
jgi:hypothetical protein